MSRRGFLRTATGAAAVAGATGAGAGTAAGQESTEVVVGPGGNLVFEPETANVAPGDTVTWTWDSDNHNIIPESQPEGASWEGHEPLENSGFTYEHTFDTEGTYSYYCQPHRSAGMVGEVVVGEGGGGSGGDGGNGTGGGGPPQIPESARTLGIATVFGMLSTLGLAYFFMKYGGDYGNAE